MQTPLVFKLLLLLAFALRLLKSNKASLPTPKRKYYLIKEFFPSKRIESSTQNTAYSTHEQIKFYYRKKVRKSGNKGISLERFDKLNPDAQLICVAYQVAKFYKRGGLYRFLWHGNDWLIAFGQSLEAIEHPNAFVYQELVAEIAGISSGQFCYEGIDWEKIYPFPDATKVYDNLSIFEKSFDLDDYVKSVLIKVSLRSK